MDLPYPDPPVDGLLRPAACGFVRLRFPDAARCAPTAVLRGTGFGFGPPRRNPGRPTVDIPGDGGNATLQALLTAPAEASITPETLTVHTHELDDVSSAPTPWT
ncbi:hypothetical protein AQI88_26120 [Streptomyces cellostaticus]|uniref:Uncharacterized protein n=1 Tax=Streptomyces cellostaticus TaxID=67285 RepID=A0A101NI80_9ACTN|nr:hypothetical protein [Streptomyces cellostaticus]KUM93559.1 hypothetical protein AQI88_26120 [Streptomyces cellostaticus]GHI04316.1 hypothetical protein Scel_26370 [Streptomyces cellostaticus]